MKEAGIEIREHVPLAPFTTFKIGGEARYFVEAKSEADVREALAFAKERGMRFVVLGGGSNVLVSDDGFDGLVIRIADESVLFDGDILTAGAGCVLLSLIRKANEQGLGGWEKLAGIPGTIGGATRGNAGAFGPEIKDFVVQVRAISTTTGETRDFSNEACAFVYRRSFFKQNPEWIITSVQVRLAQAQPDESRVSIETTLAERQKRHLQNVRAAGSYFMNPVAPSEVVALFEQEKQVKARENRVPAGWLIEKAGMKGASEGGAQASEQHPNYLINATGTATCADVHALARRIQDVVRERFGIELIPEAVMV